MSTFHNYVLIRPRCINLTTLPQIHTAWFDSGAQPPNYEYSLFNAALKLSIFIKQTTYSLSRAAPHSRLAPKARSIDPHEFHIYPHSPCLMQAVLGAAVSCRRFRRRKSVAKRVEHSRKMTFSVFFENHKRTSRPTSRKFSREGRSTCSTWISRNLKTAMVYGNAGSRLRGSSVGARPGLF